MRSFVRRSSSVGVVRHDEHGGRGPITFRRMLDATEFESKIDFVDLTVVEPGSSIGRHRHDDSEELYFIVAGSPLMRVDGDERRLQRGDVTVVRSGGSHELINDTTEAVEIFVVQVGR